MRSIELAGFVIEGLLGRGVPLSEMTLQLRVGSDQALLQGIAKAVLEAEAESPGTALILDMNTVQPVLLIIEEIHRNDDSIKH